MVSFRPPTAMRAMGYLTPSQNPIIVIEIVKLEVASMDAKEFISATTLSKKTSATLDALEKGEAEKLIILKNNAPRAVLLSIAAYEAMEEELEDLRLTALAIARLQSFDPEQAVTHGDMMERFGN